MKGILYLLPNSLGNPDTVSTIPAGIAELVRGISVYIAEDIRNARRYLKKLDREIRIDDLTFFRLNKHTTRGELPSFLEKARQGKDTALLSEAGVPGVADPGADLVRLAHREGIRVVPLTGPSSVLLSLMGSGLNGQAFQFHGYLPVKRAERVRRIRDLEQIARKTSATQIFIETPYRNESLVEDILKTCDPSTMLCIAADLTMETEFILTLPAGRWKGRVPSLHKRPAVFLMGI